MSALSYEEEKASYRRHVDQLVDVFEQHGASFPRRVAIEYLRTRSQRLITEKFGTCLTPQQQERVARYLQMMDELARECDN